MPEKPKLKLKLKQKRLDKSKPTKSRLCRQTD